MEQEEIIGPILAWLVNNNMWGHKHTELKNITKCLPKHRRGTRETKKAIDELIQNGFLSCKISTQEIHVSLNTQKKREIEEIVSDQKI